MKLYDAETAPNPRRVRIFLAEKGIDVPRQPVDLAGMENRKGEFLRKNPMAGVPMLELDDGTCISESVAICRYFEALHPEPPLLGTQPRTTVQLPRRAANSTQMSLYTAGNSLMAACSRT